MAITQVGSATSDTSPLGTDVAVPKPTGVASGDVIIAFGCTTESTPYFDTVPSGFTEFAESATGDTPNLFQTTAWYKVCGGSEPSTYTFGSGGAETAGAPLVVVMAAFRGVNTSGSPISHVSEIAGGTSSEPANPATSFTQAENGRLFFLRSCRSTTAIPTFTSSTADWTQQVQDGDYSGGTVRYGEALYVHDFDTASGSRTEPAVTCNTTETDNVYILGCLLAGDPSDSDSGTGTDSELVDVTAPDSDSGTGTETESVNIPVEDPDTFDTGVGTETEDVDATTVVLVSDNFNRADENPLNVSSSGDQWTSASTGVLGVVNNECKRVA